MSRGKPAQEQWQNIVDAFHSAAKSTIKNIPSTQRHEHQFCPELAQMSAKQPYMIYN